MSFDLPPNYRASARPRVEPEPSDAAGASPGAAPPQPDPRDGDGRAAHSAGAELIDDGQEEVFSKSAVQRGLIRDPKALGPEELARHPKSPLDLRRR